jgi:hypothetical protein
MKKPPSQRPARQPGLGQLNVVGKPYHPARRSWPEGADYNFGDGGHELRICIANASPKEVAAVERGRVEFGLMVDLPELFVVTRFRGPDARVVMSFDCSYQWHMLAPEQRTAPPAWEETSFELRALVAIVLVEATDGVILALRTMTYSPELTRALHGAIADQAGLSFDRAEHVRAVYDITKQFNTEELWDRCTVRCTGGD